MSNKLKLKASTVGYGYLTFDGSNDYGTLPADVGALAGSFVLEYNFRVTSFRHCVIFGKHNPSSGGSGGAVGWFIGLYPTAKIKFQWCAVEGSSSELTGVTTMSTGVDYKARLVSDGTTLTCSLSADGGRTWTTEFTTTSTAVLTVVGASNTYPVVLGRGRWASAWTDYFYGRIGVIRIIKGSSDPTAVTTHEYRMMTTGTNPVIIDRRGVADGTTVNGVTGTLVQADVYSLAGTLLYGPFDLTSIGKYYKSAFSWVANIATNTKIIFSSARTESIAPPGVFTQIAEVTTVGASSNVLEIPDFEINDDLEGQYLWLRVELQTTNSAYTPTITSLSAWICDRDRSKIKINLSYANRIKNPINTVDVNFTGALIGEGSSSVLPFTSSFVPVNFIRWFKPHDAEHISASVSLGVHTHEITFGSYKSTDEHITASVSNITVVVTNVGGQPL